MSSPWPIFFTPAARFFPLSGDRGAIGGKEEISAAGSNVALVERRPLLWDNRPRENRAGALSFPLDRCRVGPCPIRPAGPARHHAVMSDAKPKAPPYPDQPLFCLSCQQLYDHACLECWCLLCTLCE